MHRRKLSELSKSEDLSQGDKNTLRFDDDGDNDLNRQSNEMQSISRFVPFSSKITRKGHMASSSNEDS